MRVLRLPAMVFGALVATGFVASFAQENANPKVPPMEQPAAVPDSHSGGTSPGGTGSTGWTGGSRGQTGTTGQANANPEAAANQPLMATGQDLNGPPHRFPAGQTPE